ncbi:MAG TPA: hypothetical protein VFS10_04590 [Pyrinomonadaceae bacterium]|nr:hypothetical protein [Pyrinomonadaceae bacterium]
MNAHRLRSILSRRNAALCTPFFLLVVVTVTAFVVQSSATAGGAGDQGPPRQSIEEIKKDFNEDDLKTKDDKPPGKWGFSIHLDSKKDDPSVPAYVHGIQLLSGGGEYRGINKIKRVRVTNRSSRTISLVQVRLEVYSLNEPEKVLLEEALPFANASISPNVTEVVEIKTLYPPKLLKAIAKGGELNGEFGLRMTVQAVRFADGTFWSEPVSSALLKSPYLDQSLDFRFPTLASLVARITAPLRSPDTKRADMTRCALEPRLAASAFSSVPLEYDTCTDNSAVRTDSTGRNNCGAPSTGACYAHCSDDGWCNTWKDPKPCSGPTATAPVRRLHGDTARLLLHPGTSHLPQHIVLPLEL